MEPMEKTDNLDRSSTGTNNTAMDGGLDSSVTDQYLTFIVAEEEYGVDILCVQEIRGWESATPLPNAPDHIKGVINLRGTIVPVIDLRTCFSLEVVDYSPITVVIVLKVKTAQGSRTVGIVVDAVSDVYTLNPRDMKPAPDLGDSVATEFIRGLANIDNKMVILLDMDRLLKLDGMPDLSTLKDQVQV
ncbi:chemotaxis protein CheW [Saccharophagus degradans]|uniref:Chemotaxis protein CheW n=1 Tax=Saccharophagus degradans (strain 2-40 / ATCC 43961 / DSM 17024) TaxID=203122 RepID=Q21G16_SACD2|nr:chemotaxis protein CheW [Saccharophagus degradans]ABD82363.1 CheW-like protein [Saccharophagus degradans 2-40]